MIKVEVVEHRLNTVYGIVISNLTNNPHILLISVAEPHLPKEELKHRSPYNFGGLDWRHAAT